MVTFLFARESPKNAFYSTCTWFVSYLKSMKVSYLYWDFADDCDSSSWAMNLASINFLRRGQCLIRYYFDERWPQPNGWERWVRRQLYTASVWWRSWSHCAEQLRWNLKQHRTNCFSTCKPFKTQRLGSKQEALLLQIDRVTRLSE